MCVHVCCISSLRIIFLTFACGQLHGSLRCDCQEIPFLCFPSLTLSCFCWQNITIMRPLDFGSLHRKKKKVTLVAHSSCTPYLRRLLGGENGSEDLTQDCWCQQYCTPTTIQMKPFLVWFSFLVIRCCDHLTDAFAWAFACKDQHWRPSNTNKSTHFLPQYLHETTAATLYTASWSNCLLSSSRIKHLPSLLQKVQGSHSEMLRKDAAAQFGGWRLIGGPIRLLSGRTTQHPEKTRVKILISTEGTRPFTDKQRVIDTEGYSYL